MNASACVCVCACERVWLSGFFFILNPKNSCCKRSFTLDTIKIWIIFRYSDRFLEKDKKRMGMTMRISAKCGNVHSIFGGNFAWNFKSWDNLCNSFVQIQTEKESIGWSLSHAFLHSNQFANRFCLVGCLLHANGFPSFMKCIELANPVSWSKKIHVCSAFLFFFIFSIRIRKP